jgi:hypothetical protein
MSVMRDLLARHGDWQELLELTLEERRQATRCLPRADGQ